MSTLAIIAFVLFTVLTLMPGAYLIWWAWRLGTQPLQQPFPREKARRWSSHPELSAISEEVAFLCHLMASSPGAPPAEELPLLARGAASYRRLWEWGIISDLPFYEPVAGIPAEADTYLPAYTFPDRFLFRLEIALSGVLLVGQMDREALARYVSVLQADLAAIPLFADRAWLLEKPGALIEKWESGATALRDSLR
jgi:hypothetical protein